MIMTHAILSAALVAVLLAPGDSCSWLCGVPAPLELAEAASHCHGDAQPVAPVSDETCEEDCLGCRVRSNPIQVSGLLARTAEGAEFAIEPWRQLAGVSRRALVSYEMRRLANRFPPIDLLSMKASLKL